MMKKLIINADDFGLSPGVTRGIIDGHLKGIVSSTSAMMNTPDVQNSLIRARQQAPELSIGVHLVLTWGKPLLVPSLLTGLVDEHGHFLKISALTSQIGNLIFDAVRAEWRAQIEAFIAAGSYPDHLDSHHHCAYLSQGLFVTMLELAREFAIPIRYPPKPEGNFRLNTEPMQKYSVPSPKVCVTNFYGSSATLENLAAILAALSDGTSELMCHPGYFDQELLAGSSYAVDRETELQVLTDPRARAALIRNRISLARFSDL